MHPLITSSPTAMQDIMQMTNATNLIFGEHHFNLSCAGCII